MGVNTKIVDIQNLSFSYKKHSVLRNINASFNEKKMTVVLGRNGSGKSTLLRLMAGLLKGQEKNIFYKEKSLDSLSLKERAKLLGFMSQHHKAVFPFTVYEVVLTGRVGHLNWTPSQHDVKMALQAIERTGISHLKDRYYTELSGGEQQLVMIARVLAQQPQILLLDEPTANLDLKHTVMVMDILDDLCKDGLTVIMALHDINLAARYASDLMMLKNGEICAFGQKEIITEENLEMLYDIKVKIIRNVEQLYVALPGSGK